MAGRVAEVEGVIAHRPQTGCEGMRVGYSGCAIYGIETMVIWGCVEKA